MSAKLFPFWYLKKPIQYCPSGEQVINGGFENDLADWEQYYAPPLTAQITTSKVHSGLKAVTGPPSGLNTDPFGVKQSIDNIQTYCISEISCWYFQTYYGTMGRLRVTYTDDTSTEVTCTGNGQWYKKTLTPLADKVIKSISARLIATVFDFVFDDISIIGNGLPL